MGWQVGWGRVGGGGRRAIIRYSTLNATCNFIVFLFFVSFYLKLVRLDLYGNRRFFKNNIMPECMITIQWALKYEGVKLLIVLACFCHWFHWKESFWKDASHAAKIRGLVAVERNRRRLQQQDNLECQDRLYVVAASLPDNYNFFWPTA